jgi:transcriptional repressor NrdR
MKCPFCSCPDTQVIDSRVSEEGDTIRRRRRCSACDRRFTTYERVDLMMPAVVKRNGTRADFDPLKLRASMALALRKRPVSATALDAAVARIQERLLTSGQREISSDAVGELVMAELRQLDQVAYVRFASVYRSFGDIHEFVRAIEEFRVNDDAAK